jgi:hypothetical protein
MACVARRLEAVAEEAEVTSAELEGTRESLADDWAVDGRRTADDAGRVLRGKGADITRREDSCRESGVG